MGIWEGKEEGEIPFSHFAKQISSDTEEFVCLWDFWKETAVCLDEWFVKAVKNFCSGKYCSTLQMQTASIIPLAINPDFLQMLK